jgi:hypothetical protein
LGPRTWRIHHLPSLASSLLVAGLRLGFLEGEVDLEPAIKNKQKYIQSQVCCLHHHLPFHQGHHYPLLHRQIWVLWECHHHLLPDLLNLHLQEQHEKKLQLLQSCTQEWMKRWLFP